MRWFHYAMVTVVAVLGLSAAQAEPAAPDAGLGGRHLTMTLVAETEHPAAGSNVTLALPRSRNQAGTAIGKIPATRASLPNWTGRCPRA